MDIFDGLTALGGLCLFLFGMQIMAEALQRRAGGRLEGLLRRMTRSRWAGFFTGLAVTAAVQSSSAAMVMVVGFVNSGMLTLRQAVGVIMGILSLSPKNSLQVILATSCSVAYEVKGAANSIETATAVSRTFFIFFSYLS